MASYYSFLVIVLLFLANLIACDTSLVSGIDYYISSTINPAFINNLLSFTDGTSDWPGIGKDGSGSPAFGKWYLQGVSGSNTFQLVNEAGDLVLDIKGGTSSAQDNPKPFLNKVQDTSLDGQAGWVFIKAKETNLYNQDFGFWGAIVNQNWNLALQAPVEPTGIYDEVVDLAPVPISWDAGRYWFFASVTRGTVWYTATVTQVTTSTGSPVTQTVNADGPTSTITSVVVQSLTTTIQVTSTSEILARRALAPRQDFTTLTSTTTSTYWQTVTVAGATAEVTNQGGFVYVTALVTSSIYATATSTVIVVISENPTSFGAAPTASSTIAAVNSPSPTSSDAAQNTPIVATGKPKSVPVAAIVGGVLGGILLLVIFVAAWLYRNYRKRRLAAGDTLSSNRRSGTSSYAAATGTTLGNSDSQYWTAVGPETGEKTSELARPAEAELMETQVPRPEATNTAAAVERHELGLGATMVNGPHYEMPGHDNWP